MITYLSHTLHRDAYRRRSHVDRAYLVCSVGVLTSFCYGLWPELFAHLLCTCVLHHPKGLLRLPLAAATPSGRGWHEVWTTASCIRDCCYSSQFSLLLIRITAMTTNVIQVSCVKRQPVMVSKYAARMTCIWNKKYHMCEMKYKETKQKKTFSLCSS